MTSDTGKVVPLRRPARCPICKRPAEAEHRPFCSRHCADVDLARWFGGAYKVETDEVPAGPGSNAGDEG